MKTLSRLKVTRMDDPVLRDHNSFPLIDLDAPGFSYVSPDHPGAIFLDREKVVGMKGRHTGENILFRFHLTLENTTKTLEKMTNGD